jgi:hypothetical protein
MVAEYESSILCGGSLFFCEKLTFTDTTITWDKDHGPFGIFTKSMTVPRSGLHNVIVDERILGSNIHLIFKGPNDFSSYTIIGSGFDSDEAEEIRYNLMLK